VITPNNDGINDALVIPCLLEANAFQKAQLLIINRWGDEVYRSPRPYLNNWAGTYNGEDLPVGTYFYILDLGEGSTPMRGFFLIQR
jgi:gliding motility-associated-like protein